VGFPGRRISRWIGPGALAGTGLFLTGSVEAVRNRTAVAKAVREWFEANGLPLFFRNNRSPYVIWILEVMGQQTQLSRAVAYLERWLHRFPDVSSLASTEEQEVLKLWEGLGYYSRARNIHKAAQQIVRDYNAIFPDTYSSILKLPGVGEYTAAAVASMVFGEAVPAVDANVRRIFARLLLWQEDTGSSTFTLLVREHMEKMFSIENPGLLNEGMMELGERICLRRKPDCARCPVGAFCLAFQKGEVERIPVRKQREAKIDRSYAVYRLFDTEGRVLLSAPKKRGIWPGLWSLPGILVEEEPSAAALEEWFGVSFGIDINVELLLPPVRHSYTRYRLLFYPVSGRTTETGAGGGSLVAVEQGKMGRLPFPSGILKVLRELAVSSSSAAVD